MPLYDDIQDAFELLPGGAPVTLSNVAATDDGTFEDDLIGNESVWLKVDLSDYIDLVEIEISLSGVTGTGFHPYMEVIRVTDPTFDPTAPDASKVDYITGAAYVGDGTATPPAATFELDGGLSSSSSGSDTGIFYFFFTDWDYDGTEGTASVAYVVPDPPLCVDAVDVINPASPTATIVSGRVQETWDGPWDFGYHTQAYPTRTLKWTWAGPAGAYKVAVVGQMESTPSFDGVVGIMVFVNGRSFISPRAGSFTPANGTASRMWFVHDNFASDVDGVYSNDDYPYNPYVVLSPGDTVEVMVSSYVTFSGAMDPFEIDRVCFLPVEQATTTCTGSYNFPEEPLGDQWGSPNGWGGQKFVPDEIWALYDGNPMGGPPTIPYDEDYFPWGVNWTDYDMCVTDDGVPYVISKDEFGSGPTQKFFVVIKRYDVDTDDWIQVATLNIAAGDVGVPADGCTIEFGPDGFVYAAWWEVTSVVGLIRQWDWHCVKLDPSDDTYVELGSGQHSVNAGADPAPSDNYPFNTLALTIAVSENGDVYVAAIEHRTGTPTFYWGAYVWRWDGATWTDLALPAPAEFDTYYEVIGENQFWDQLISLVCARPSEGPVTDGITVFYCYRTIVDNPDPEDPFEGFLTETIQYTVGTGWTDPITTDWLATLGRTTRTNTETVLNARITAIDHNLMWSSKLGRMVVVCDFGSISFTQEIWDMAQMNDDNDQWEYIEPIAPPSSAGPWNQTRNSAAISPVDGDIYAARMTEALEGFEPWVIKHSPGYAFGHADGTRNPLGYVGEDGPGYLVEFYGTTNYRIRMSGQSAYVIANLYAESQEYAIDQIYGEGVYVFKLDYQACAPSFRPHIYRRILG